MNKQKRRSFLKVLGVCSAAMGTKKALPGKWTTPVVDSVLLPAHAQTSQPECAVYAATGIDADGFARDETLSVCAVVCPGDSTATVTHQTFFTSFGGSNARRTGQIPLDGSPGDMIATVGPNCQLNNQNGPRPATLTDLTDDSVTYTLDRPSTPDIVATLLRTDSCPDFPALSACTGQ